MEFTTEQKEFLAHPRNKHACLLAGPGTGKSTTVIEYASNLSEEDRAKARFITFTRAATAELTQKMPETHLNELQPNTFHSFAFSILLRNGGLAEIPQPIRVLNEWEWDSLVRPRITRLLKLGHNWRDADELRREMAAKWESLADDEKVDVPQEVRAQFLSQWQKHRELFGYTEISEIPYLLFKTLRSHHDIDIGALELLIVDEYQDLNACDIACLQELISRGVIVFAVGDDDQSIYKFRMADPAGIRRFPEQYSADKYPLTIAQRFGRQILDWATYVINFDSGRSRNKPTIIPQADNNNGHVAYLEFRGQVAERQGIAQLIKWLHEKKQIPYEEILVLGRTGKITSPMIKALKNAGITVSDPNVVKECFKKPDLQESMSLLRLICEPGDSLSWWNLLRLRTKISASKIDALVNNAAQNNRRFGEVVLDLNKTGELTKIAGRKAAECVDNTLKCLQRVEIPDCALWGEWITRLTEDGILPSILDPINGYLTQIDKILGDKVSLDRYLGHIYPVSQDLASRPVAGTVRVMIMVRSKGLTVRACIVAGCESDIIPHPKGDRDEESRLLYVAMTRPREFLFLTRALRRTGPSARAGKPRVRSRRSGCPFLEHGPVTPDAGENYIAALFKP